MKKRVLPLLLALAVLLGIGTVLIVGIATAPKLARQLEGVWLREGGEDWHLELTAKDGVMEYDFVSGQFPDVTETLYTYGYKTRSGDRLLVTYPADGGRQTVMVRFSENGKQMTLSPAITTAEDQETWHRK